MVAAIRRGRLQQGRPAARRSRWAFLRQARASANVRQGACHVLKGAAGLHRLRHRHPRPCAQRRRAWHIEEQVVVDVARPGCGVRWAPVALLLLRHAIHGTGRDGAELLPLRWGPEVLQRVSGVVRRWSGEVA